MPEKKIKTVLWVHSFPESVLNSGVFMHKFLYATQHHKEFSGQYKVDEKSFPMVGGIRMFVKRLCQLRELAKDYDIVHVQWGSFLSLVCAIALTKLPETHLVLTLRGSDFYRLKRGSYQRRLHSFLASIFGKIASNFYEIVVVMSDRMLVDLNNSRMFLRKRTSSVVLTDPIDLKLYQSNSSLDGSNPSDYLANRSIRVLFSALDPTSEIKRRNLALRAVAVLKDKVTDRQVEMVDLTDVPHSKVPKLLQSVDVVLLTSVHEGWPNIIKEALASGVPFVSTDVSDLAGVANEAGELCKVVFGRSNDQLVDALGEALFSVTRHSRTESDKRLLISTVSHFDYEIVLQQLMGIYEEVVNG